MLFLKERGLFGRRSGKCSQKQEKGWGKAVKFRPVLAEECEFIYVGQRREQRLAWTALI